jgi:hypothetical protein
MDEGSGTVEVKVDCDSGIQGHQIPIPYDFYKNGFKPLNYNIDEIRNIRMYYDHFPYLTDEEKKKYLHTECVLVDFNQKDVYKMGINKKSFLSFPDATGNLLLIKQSPIYRDSMYYKYIAAIPSWILPRSKPNEELFIQLYIQHMIPIQYNIFPRIRSYGIGKEMTVHVEDLKKEIPFLVIQTIEDDLHDHIVLAEYFKKNINDFRKRCKAGIKKIHKQCKQNQFEAGYIRFDEYKECLRTLVEIQTYDLEGEIQKNKKIPIMYDYIKTHNIRQNSDLDYYLIFAQIQKIDPDQIYDEQDEKYIKLLIQFDESLFEEEDTTVQKYRDQIDRDKFILNTIRDFASYLPYMFYPNKSIVNTLLSFYFNHAIHGKIMQSFFENLFLLHINLIVHNDLHHNNVFVHPKTHEIKFIDFDRSIINLGVREKPNVHVGVYPTFYPSEDQKELLYKTRNNWINASRADKETFLKLMYECEGTFYSQYLLLPEFLSPFNYFGYLLQIYENYRFIRKSRDFYEEIFEKRPTNVKWNFVTANFECSKTIDRVIQYYKEFFLEQYIQIALNKYEHSLPFELKSIDTVFKNQNPFSQPENILKIFQKQYEKEPKIKKKKIKGRNVN